MIHYTEHPERDSVQGHHEWLIAFVGQCAGKKDGFAAVAEHLAPLLVEYEDNREELDALGVECPECKGDCLSDGRALCGTCGATGSIIINGEHWRQLRARAERAESEVAALRVRCEAAERNCPRCASDEHGRHYQVMERQWVCERCGHREGR